VVLGERYQNRLLHGRVVYGPMAGTVVEIEQNDFPIRAEEAKSLLTQIFQTFRDEVGDSGGITVYMDTEMWLAWLDIRFPGAAITIHTHLLAPTKYCP
jgi:hypothetical protein